MKIHAGWYCVLAVAKLVASPVAGYQVPSQSEPDDLAWNKMLRVLEIDRVLGKQRDLLSKAVSLESAVRGYLLGLDAIDFSGCSSEFHRAFIRYRNAWEHALPFLRRHSALRGEMHALFDQIRAANEVDKTELDDLMGEIMASWSAVEACTKPSAAGETPKVTLTLRYGEETYRYANGEQLTERKMEDLIAARRSVWIAWFAGDEERLRQLVPPEAITGDASKPDWVLRPAILEESKAFAASGAKLKDLVFANNLIHVYGDVVILYVNFRGKTTSGSETNEMSGRAVEVFVRRNSQWLNTGWYLVFDEA